MIILKFLLILLILVTVHEFGHFIVAKIFNVYVSEFALGFGPKIFSHKGKETEFTIRALPLGGYAAMVGEDGDVDEDLAHVPFERTLKGVNRFKQFLIMFAGSFMNLLLAFLIFTGLSGVQESVSVEPVIGNVLRNSPAEKAGLQKNDRIISFKQDDKITKVATYTDIRLFSALNTEGNSYEVLVKRGNESKSFTIIPKLDEESKTYLAGYSGTINKVASNPLTMAKNGLANTIGTSKDIFTTLKMLFTGKVGVDNLSGPVGIVKMTEEVSDQAGLIGLVSFTALLSVNLAIFNLLPIPALDGGRILILAIESITRRRISPEWESRIIGGSFILLIGLIIFVTVNDIGRLFR